MKSILPLVVGLLCLMAIAAAPPPETLKLQDLANRPDRWPAQVTLKKDVRIGGHTLKAGDKATIIEFNGSDVGLDAGNDRLVALAPDETDLLEAANAAWSKLTPEQKALDLKAVLADASLWPAKVKCTGSFTLDGGKVIPANSEFTFCGIEQNQAVLFIEKNRLQADVNTTDLVVRARELVAIAPDKRPARIADALRDSMVDADGKPVKKEDLDQTKLFALYYGASWCGPCRQFSPTFVKYINGVAAANPKLTVVLVSFDEKDEDMMKYMKEEKMPWTAIPMAASKKSHLLMSYGKGSIPQLIIVDKYGKVLANSYNGQTYVGPKTAQAVLDKALKSGAGK